MEKITFDREYWQKIATEGDQFYLEFHLTYGECIDEECDSLITYTVYLMDGTEYREGEVEFCKAKDFTNADEAMEQIAQIAFKEAFTREVTEKPNFAVNKQLGEFHVEIRESLSKTVSVKASSPQNAIGLVMQMYKKGEIDLGCKNLASVEVGIVEETEKKAHTINNINNLRFSKNEEQRKEG